MDPATLIGVVVALIAVFGSMIMEGGNPVAIILIPPMLLVFVGTFGVTMATGMQKDFMGALGAMKDAFLSSVEPPDAAISKVVELAELARREGLLALEESAKSIEDPFLKKGVELAVDGTDPEEVRDILENEIRATKAEAKNKAKFFGDMGAFAPTLGIIGTVLGLVHVLENLSEPDKLGHLIAGAFVATLWGVMSANVLWLPMSKKLARVGELQAHHMELVMEGILSIQAGANPRVVEQKLVSHLDASARAARAKAA